MAHQEENGWTENKMYVQYELKRLSDSHMKLIEAIQGSELQNLREHAKLAADIAALKVRASAWGAVAGAIMAIMIILAGWIGSKASAEPVQQPAAATAPAPSTSR